MTTSYRCLDPNPNVKYLRVSSWGDKSRPCFPLTSPCSNFMDHLTPATIPFDIMSLPTCCGNSCGMLFPLVSNGSYLDPRGEGKTFVAFKLAGSPLCGIPVAKVLRGDLEGLIERDELAKLNPNAGSIRLRIEVGSLSPVRPPTTQVNSC